MINDNIGKIIHSIHLQQPIVKTLKEEEETIHLMDIILDFSQDFHHSFDSLITIYLNHSTVLFIIIKDNHFGFNLVLDSSFLSTWYTNY